MKHRLGVEGPRRGVLTADRTARRDTSAKTIIASYSRKRAPRISVKSISFLDSSTSSKGIGALRFEWWGEQSMHELLRLASPCFIYFTSSPVGTLRVIISIP